MRLFIALLQYVENIRFNNDDIILYYIINIIFLCTIKVEWEYLRMK